MGVGKVIDPGWTWDDKIPLAQALQAGHVLYISGQISLNPDGTLHGEGSVRAQAQRIFENLELLLASAGASLDNVVKLTAYLTDMRGYSEYNEVRNAFLKQRRTASTTVQVSGLAFPGLLVEVEAIAHL